MIYIRRPLILWNDDVIKWKHFPRYWPSVRGIHRSPVNSPHKGQWRGALMFTLICARINGWVNTREAGDLRRHRAHYDVIVMESPYQNDHLASQLMEIYINVNNTLTIYKIHLATLWQSFLAQTAFFLGSADFPNWPKGSRSVAFVLPKWLWFQRISGMWLLKL